MATLRLMCGDNLVRLKELDDDSVDLVVTDPPYGIDLMGKEWDNIQHSEDTKDKNQAMVRWHEKWLAECFRVLRPGGLIKSCIATRTQHRLALAMSNVGFVLDPQNSIEAWTYRGFPKNIDMAAALDFKFGVLDQRTEVISSLVRRKNFVGVMRGRTRFRSVIKNGVEWIEETAPFHDLAKQWDGYGTALAPRWEVIVIGKKP